MPSGDKLDSLISEMRSGMQKRLSDYPSQISRMRSSLGTTRKTVPLEEAYGRSSSRRSKPSPQMQRQRRDEDARRWQRSEGALRDSFTDVLSSLDNLITSLAQRKTPHQTQETSRSSLLADIPKGRSFPQAGLREQTGSSFDRVAFRPRIFWDEESIFSENEAEHEADEKQSFLRESSYEGHQAQDLLGATLDLILHMVLGEVRLFLVPRTLWPDFIQALPATHAVLDGSLIPQSSPLRAHASRLPFVALPGEQHDADIVAVARLE